MGGNPAGPGFPCGGLHQKPCPPEPAVVQADGTRLWTEEQIQEHGEECFQAGKAEKPEAR